MADIEDVVRFLRPNGEWAIYGNSYEDIVFVNCEPFTKDEFNSAFTQYDTWKEKQETDALAAKTTAEAKLSALGLTSDDLKALGLA